MRAVIQFHLVNARLAHQPLLNQPHAGGTSDAAQHQRGFALVFRQRFHKFGLHFGQVVEFELRHDFIGRQLGFFGLGGAVFVVAAQPGIDDALGNGLATHAAGGLLLVVVNNG